MSTDDPSPLPREAVSRLRAHRETAMALPEPGPSWALAETDLSEQGFRVVKQLGVITSVGWERVKVAADRDDGAGNYDRKRWVTDPTAYEWIQAHLSDATECPADGCHATGIHNPKGVGGYRCSNDDCDERLTREQAEAIVG